MNSHNQRQGRRISFSLLLARIFHKYRCGRTIGLDYEYLLSERRALE